jgi:L-asparaginase / beta-aspartyl-peptidase
MSDRYALAVHGGAGTIAIGEADEGPYHRALATALQAGEAVLQAGGSAFAAVVEATVALENEPLFNAGKGAVFTADGTHELDAAVMEGTGLQAGAVAGVRTVANPVRLAVDVMQATPCVLLVGEGAERLARARGHAVCAPDYFHTDARWSQLLMVQQQERQAGTNRLGSGVMALDHTGAAMDRTAPLNQSGKMGTVGAVARDSRGHLAAAVSTGGMTNKRPGRVGDSPLIGAGLYANDSTCAVCATGTGETFIRACVAHDIHARMAYGGQGLAAAADAVVMEELTRLAGTGGVIAIDRQGQIAMPFNSVGMYRGWVRAGEAVRTAIFR